MLLGPQDIAEAQIEQGNVAVGNQNIGEVGQVPEGSQVHAGNTGQDAKGNDDQAQDTDKIDKCLAVGDPMSTHLCEGYETQQAGEGKKAKAEGDQQGNNIIEGSPRGQFGDRSHKLGQLAQVEPGRSLVGLPYPSHDNDKTSQGTDDNGVQKDADGLDAALVAGVVYVSSGGSHGNGTLACLIGHKATFDTLGQDRSKGTAEYGFRLKGLGDYRIEKPGNTAEIEDDQKENRDDIDYCHNGN